jgi:hypothetical protein
MQTALARNGFIRRRRMQRRPIGISPTTQVSISTLPIGRVTFGLLAGDVRHTARRNRDLAKSIISFNEVQRGR